MGTIKRADLARILSSELGCSKALARPAVDTAFEALIGAISQGNRVEIRGFGAWTVKETNARPDARNPKTGERVFVPARRKVAFKPGKILKEALSRSPASEEILDQG